MKKFLSVRKKRFLMKLLHTRCKLWKQAGECFTNFVDVTLRGYRSLSSHFVNFPFNNNKHGTIHCLKLHIINKERLKKRKK